MPRPTYAESSWNLWLIHNTRHSIRFATSNAFSDELLNITIQICQFHGRLTFTDFLDWLHPYYIRDRSLGLMSLESGQMSYIGLEPIPSKCRLYCANYTNNSSTANVLLLAALKKGRFTTIYSLSDCSDFKLVLLSIYSPR